MSDLANRDQALKLELDKLIGDAEVETVARALCVDRDADFASGGFHPSGVELDIGEAWWTGYIEQARAAIEALRPTAIEYGRRVLALAESKEALAKRLGEPPLRGLKGE